MSARVVNFKRGVTCKTGACSLCHSVAELKYHYDICEPCHQSEEDPHQSDSHISDDESLPSDASQDAELCDSDVEPLPDDAVQLNIDAPAAEPRLKRSNANAAPSKKQ